MKDTNNLTSYELWSSGEYDNPIIRVIDGTSKIENSISTIGETSLSFQQNINTNYGYIRFQLLDDASINTTYKVSFDIYCPDIAFTCILRDNYELSRLILPKNRSIQHIELTCKVQVAGFLYLQFFNNTSLSRLFIDNISVISII